MNTKGTDWAQRHYVARSGSSDPRAVQHIALLNGLETSIAAHLAQGGSFPDAEASEAYGSVIEGGLRLLNQNTGPLDAGTLWSEYAGLAETVCWNIDESQIAWSS